MALNVRSLIILILAPLTLAAADFTFYATLRAGQPATAGWEMGLGTNAAADQSTGQFRWSNSSPFWRTGGQPQNFRIGWQSASQTAYVTVFDSANNPWTRQLTNSGPAVGVNTIWTLPSAGFFTQAAATGRPASINLANLTLAPGIQVLSGGLPSSIGSSSPPASTSSMSAPLVIRAASTGGDWYIAGNIRFAGLITGGGGNGASNSDLQFAMQAAGVDTPESSTVLLTAGGLLVLLGWHRKRRPDAV